MADSFTAATCNISGLQIAKTRAAVFNWLKSLCINIIFLQETHCRDDDEVSDISNWKKEWGGHSEWSPGTNRSRGVAVLFNFDFEYSIESLVIDEDGRYIRFTLVIDEQRFSMINIYSPNNEKHRIKFFKDMVEWVDLREYNLVGGDYNCTQMSRIDRFRCSSKSNDGGQSELKELMSKKNLEDIYRRRNPNTKSYTWCRGNKKSRIDYWLVSKTLENRIQSVEHQGCPYSDHDLVFIRVSLTEKTHGPGSWKMNSEVIESDLFKNVFSKFWKEWQQKRSHFSDIGLWWDLGKVKIKELTIWCACRIKLEQSNERKVLEKRIASLKTNPDYDSHKLHELESNLRDILDEESNGAKVRSRVNWFEEGEKPTRFFHALEKTKSKGKSWERILDKNGQIVEDEVDIMKVQVDFYKDLYSTKTISEDELNFFGNFVTKKVSAESQEMLNENLTIDEFSKVIKLCKKDSSPGPDGITFHFYKLFWNILKDDLLLVYENSFRNGKLTYSQYLALIIMLYKKGIREDIRNWRPISLSNTDTKILTKVFAERIKLVLPEIIHKDQFGCVKGRKIGHSIRLINDVHSELNHENVMILTDKQKAFDFVEWRWLFYVLKCYGFGDFIINWIRIIYIEMKSAVLSNGFVSEYFELSRGIRQGDPLSALLYIIQAEPLAECLRQSNSVQGVQIKDKHGMTHEMKGSQYVDDSNNMLRNHGQIDQCLEFIDRFGYASGSRINRSKTIALVSEKFQNKQNIRQDLNFQTEIDKVLGVPIGHGEVTEFWKRKITKIKNRLNFWKMRDLSMIGKVYIVKSLIIPTLHYASAHIDIDGDTIESVQSIIWDFIWKWGTRFVSKDVCYLPNYMGGLGLPNYDLVVKTSRIKMVIDIMREDDSWGLIARRHFSFLDQKFDINYFALLVDNSKELIEKSSIPEYYKQCLLAFQELNRKGGISLENSIIWCNERIKFNNNVLIYPHWSRAGMRFLSDILCDGILDRDSICRRLQRIHKQAGFVFEFSRLSRAISSYDGVLVNDSVPGFEPRFQDMIFKMPETGELCLKSVFDLTSKDIYSILVDPDTVERKSEIYWTSKLGGIPLNFSNWYSNLFGSRIISHKVSVFNWRLFHGQVLTERMLVKMRKSNGTCSLCREFEEDTLHLFVTCSKLEQFWISVKNLLNEIGIEKLETFHQLVGFIEREDKINIPNMVLSEARWQIWKFRCKNRNNNNDNKLSLMYLFKYNLKQNVVVLKRSKKLNICNDSLGKILSFCEL